MEIEDEPENKTKPDPEPAAENNESEVRSRKKDIKTNMQELTRDMEKFVQNPLDSFRSLKRKSLDLSLVLMPHMLPWKLGASLLLLSILNEDKNDKRDELGLLRLGLVAGSISLAIVVHSSYMGYTFRSFGHLWTYKPDRVIVVKKIAHVINGVLSVAEFVIVAYIFFYCIYFWNHIDFKPSRDTNEDRELDLGEFHEDEEIFVFTFICCAVTFLTGILGIGLAFFLCCCEGSLYNYLLNNHPRILGSTDDCRQKIPTEANYVIDEGLATVLIILYIGIKKEDVGEYVIIRELSLAVAMITIIMTLLQTIIVYAMHLSSRDGKLDSIEVGIIKFIHITRYCLAFLQVLLLLGMFIQSTIIVLGYKKDDPGWKCPARLNNLALLLSTFVLIAFIVGSVEVIFLRVSFRKRKEKPSSSQTK